jgi:hypothetical protein
MEKPDKIYLIEEMKQPLPLADTELQQLIYKEVLPKLSMEQLLSLHQERNLYWDKSSPDEFINSKPLITRVFIEWLFDEANDIFMFYSQKYDIKNEYIHSLKNKLQYIDTLKQNIMTPPMPPHTLWNLSEIQKYKRVLKKYNQFIDKMKEVLDIEKKIIDSLRYVL